MLRKLPEAFPILHVSFTEEKNAGLNSIRNNRLGETMRTNEQPHVQSIYNYIRNTNVSVAASVPPSVKFPNLL